MSTNIEEVTVGHICASNINVPAAHYGALILLLMKFPWKSFRKKTSVVERIQEIRNEVEY